MTHDLPVKLQTEEDLINSYAALRASGVFPDQIRDYNTALKSSNAKFILGLDTTAYRPYLEFNLHKRDMTIWVEQAFPGFHTVRFYKRYTSLEDWGALDRINHALSTKELLDMGFIEEY